MAGDRVVFNIVVGVEDGPKAEQLRALGADIVDRLTPLSGGLTYHWCQGTWVSG
jgi:hypothetical protein